MPAYGYYPTQYNAYPTQMNVGQAQSNNGIVWVQGEAGAKSYLVGAGQSVLLMDAEGSTFYIKSTDNSGMPMPLRVFDYKERTALPSQQASIVKTENFVTHEELEKWTEDLLARINKQEDA